MMETEKGNIRDAWSLVQTMAKNKNRNKNKKTEHNIVKQLYSNKNLKKEKSYELELEGML